MMVKYSVLVVAFIVVSIILFTNPFNFSQGIVGAVAPWTTLTLAFATFFTILRSDIKERRAKTIARLADILDWVENIIRLTHVVETIKPPSLDDSDKTYELLQLADKINEFNRQKEIGKHMQILAWRVEKSLYVGVKSLISAIDEMLREDWKNPNLREIRDLLKEHEHRIYGLASPLIDNVIKKLEEQ